MRLARLAATLPLLAALPAGCGSDRGDVPGPIHAPRPHPLRGAVAAAHDGLDRAEVKRFTGVDVPRAARGLEGTGKRTPGGRRVLVSFRVRSDRVAHVLASADLPRKPRPGVRSIPSGTGRALGWHLGRARHFIGVGTSEPGRSRALMAVYDGPGTATVYVVAETGREPPGRG